MQYEGSGHLLTLCLVPITAYAASINVDLGTADTFPILAGSDVTNTGPSIAGGKLGVSPGSAISGFPPGTVSGTIHDADAVAGQAQNNLTTTHNFAVGESCRTNLAGQDLGGLTLMPGVYCFTSSAQLTGTLTLNSQGSPNAVFVFQIGSTLTTASVSAVVVANGGEGDNVFWQVASSATLGTTSRVLVSPPAQTSSVAERCAERRGHLGHDDSIDSAGCETTSSGSGGRWRRQFSTRAFHRLAVVPVRCTGSPVAA